MEPTLSAYEPTWRDRFAQWMLGDQRPTAGQREFVTGLLGSSGTGSTGASAVDMTPLGGLLSAQDNAQHGDYKGAALAALPMPVKAGASMVKRAAEEAAPAIERGIIAYHGSPHSFDRFDLSKIGTGEGAQAYGHGLYFAENEGVARGYREALAPHGRGAAPEDVAARAIQGANGDRQAALDELRRRINDANARGVPYDQVQELMRARNVANTNPEVAGSMYQVRINADPEHFLDWDKPLSEQSEHVRAALTPEGLGLQPSGPHGKKGYYGWTDNNERLVGRATTGSVPPNAFNDGELGFNLYKGTGSWSPQEGTERLKAAGIPGIKYLDQGSRAAGDGSRNYVVFDDSMIEILKKYGLVGLLGGGAAVGASQSPNAQQSAPGL